MTDFWTAIIDFATTTTTRVGTGLLKDFGQVQADQKADGTLVTQSDKWADQEIQDAIASTFDNHGILSEEGKHSFPDTEWCWVIDPLNRRPIHSSTDAPSNNHFFNLCSRSTAVIQPGFPCKVRMLGVASYNFLAVAAGATLGSVERNPKIWDLAAAWAIVQAAGGSWISLDSEPVFPLIPGTDYGDRSFPTLVVSRSELVPVFKPFLRALV